MPVDQDIYVGNNRHDVIIIGDTMVQHLLDRPIATRYHELHPGISDTAIVQQEMIKDLQEKGVNVLILKRIFADSTLEKAKGIAEGTSLKSAPRTWIIISGRIMLKLIKLDPIPCWCQRGLILVINRCRHI